MTVTAGYYSPFSCDVAGCMFLCRIMGSSHRHLPWQLLSDNVMICAPPVRKPRLSIPPDNIRAPVKCLIELYPALSLSKTKRHNSTDSPKSSTSRTKHLSRGDPPPVSDDATLQGEYHHLLESVWFFNDAPLAFQTLFSQSITCSTASLYMPHVGHWFECSCLHNISPIDPFLHDIASYISTRAQSLPTV